MPEQKVILILQANPGNLAPWTAQELNKIQNAKSKADKHGTFTLVEKPAVRITDLRQALLDHNPWMVHLSAPVSRDGKLLLHDEGNGEKQVEIQIIAKLLKNFSGSLSAVILNAPLGEKQLEAFTFLPSAITHAGAVGGAGHIAFSEGLYDGLFRFKAEDLERMEDLARAFSHAFSLGANAIDLECGQGGDVPKLYCKPPAASPEPPAPPPSVPRRLSIPREFYKRCDRETASAALEHLFAQPPDRPKVLLIHGPEEESPASLAQRLAEDIRRERSAADEAAFVTDELTLRPDTSQEAFSYQIVRKLEVDHPEAAALFARRRQPLLILPVRVEWGDAVEPLLRWCLDAFWRTGIPAGREVFVLVQLIHQANKEKRGFSLFGSADPAKKLHKLIDACCALPVYARPVPLEPVARRHVKESLRKIGLIEDLHILQRVEAEVPDPAPMERVEAWLRQFAPPLT